MRSRQVNPHYPWTRECIDPSVRFGAMTGARRPLYYIATAVVVDDIKGLQTKAIAALCTAASCVVCGAHRRDRNGIKHEIIQYEERWAFREFFRRAKDPPGATPLAIRRAFGSGRVQLSPAAPGIPGGPQHFVDTANG